MEEFMSLGLPQDKATDKAWESLLPIAEVRARENRRAFAHLLQAAGPAPTGVERSIRKRGDG